MESVFNANNVDHKSKKGATLFLGDDMGLYDSINKKYPELFDLYKLQKAQDWSENEVNLAQSRLDFEKCSKSAYDIMIRTIMWQWEADSIASRSISNLLAPFITNSEYFAMVMKQSEIEVLHALTYSEIVRQCLSNANSILEEIMGDQNVLRRSKVLERTFNQTLRLGARYNLGEKIEEHEIKRQLLLTVTALLALEAIEFIASFSCTFALCEQGLFMGIGQLVQKIMLDEMLHTKMDFATIDILLNKESGWAEIFNEIKNEIKAILDEVVEQEIAWSDHIFSEDRAIVGLNPQLLKEWVFYNAKPIYDYMGIEFSWEAPEKQPLPWMDAWMNPDKQQNANQEMDNNAYRLNVNKDDMGSDEFDF